MQFPASRAGVDQFAIGRRQHRQKAVAGNQVWGVHAPLTFEGAEHMNTQPPSELEASLGRAGR